MLNPSQRVEQALRGGHADRVPFTVYSPKLSYCRAERTLRNRGLCIVERGVPFLKSVRPNVQQKTITYQENGRTLMRTEFHTPVGTLSTLSEPAGFTSWRHEHLFKTPEDYKVLLFMIRDEQISVDYAALRRAQQAADGDVIFRGGLGSEPLQALVSGLMMGTEHFCLEWMDHRDEILKLYEALVENRRAVYPLAAEAPLLHFNYGGNVTPEIIGLETFEKYYVPHYNEAAEVLHRHGKLLGSHLDANCRLLARAIAGTGLDFIEAFTPAPDTDMTLAEARAAWPDKVLWLNFPSSLHLSADERIEKETFEMLASLEHIDGLLMGITEDVPVDRWRDSFAAIMDGLERHARACPERYA